MKSKKTKLGQNQKVTPQTKITYDDIEDIVEFLVKKKARGFTFDCWAEEDIAQEIRIICLKALDSFDATKVAEDKWKNYFGRCVDNRLRNLKRDNYLRQGSPCKKDCPDLHKDKPDEGDDPEDLCKRYLRFRKNSMRKLLVRHPFSIDGIRDTVKDSNSLQEINAIDLEDYLMAYIPIRFRGDLKLMLDGDSDLVSSINKKTISRLVNEILD